MAEILVLNIFLQGKKYKLEIIRGKLSQARGNDTPNKSRAVERVLILPAVILQAEGLGRVGRNSGRALICQNFVAVFILGL